MKRTILVWKNTYKEAREWIDLHYMPHLHYVIVSAFGGFFVEAF